MMRLNHFGCVLAAGALALGAVACGDRPGDVAGPGGAVQIRLRGAAMGNTSSAYGKVDAAHVTVSLASAAVLDTTVSFAGASSTEVTLSVRLPDPSGSVLVSLALLARGAVLFQGSGSAQLRRGTTTQVPVTVAPVVTLAAPDSVTLTALGDTVRLGGAVVFASGDTLTGSSVTWQGDGGNVARVTSNGLAIALSEGSAQATVSSAAPALTRTTRVLVRAVVARVTVSPDTFSVGVGGARTLTAVARDRRGNVLSRTIAWQSSNAAVATVDASGVVRGVSAGTATITGSAGGQSGTATVTVRSIPVAAVSVTPTGSNVVPGGTLQLTATTYDAAGNVLTGRVIAWSSSNSAIAAVSGTGLVTGVAVGTATITATSEGVSGSAGVTVGQPLVAASPTRLAFSATVGAGNPQTQNVLISNGGTGTLTGITVTASYPAGTPQGWITPVTLSSTTAPASLTVGVNAGNLPVGSYQATLTIGSSVPNSGAVNVGIFLDVSNVQPIVGVSRSSLSLQTFSTQGSATDSLTVFNAGNGTLTGITMTTTYPAGTPSGWLSVSPATSATAPFLLWVTASAYTPAGPYLGYGTYYATVVVSSSVPGAGSQSVAVTFNVTQPPILTVTPSSLSISAGDTTTKTITITNTGTGTITGIAAGAPTYTCSVAGTACPSGWLVRTAPGSTAPTSMTVRHGFMTAGYGATATFTISSSAGSQQVTVTVP